MPGGFVAAPAFLHPEGRRESPIGEDARVSIRDGLASVKARAQVAQVFLIIQMVAAVLAILVGMVVIYLDFASGTPVVGPWSFASLGTVLLLWVVQFAATVAYFLWLHRARANLVAMGAAELAYSPAWSVACHLVPLANFVLPFRVMKETFNRSHGEPPELALSTVDDASGWWACTIGAALLFGPWLVLLALAAIPNMYVVMPPGTHALLLLLSLLLLLGATRYLYRIIGAITDAQLSGGNVRETFA
jgi:hypothetical protein